MSVAGDLQNLDGALRDVLSHYQPGSVGLAEITSCMVALTYAEWAWWSWLEAQPSASIAGGSAETIVMYTVPDNERVWLDGVVVRRNGGDNDLDYVDAAWPSDYRSGSLDDIRLVELATNATRLYWPDENGSQAVVLYTPGPILLEPGSQIRMRTGGAGASASVFHWFIRMRRSKLVRALAP